MMHFHRMMQTCNWAYTLLMFNGGHPIHSHNWQGGNSHWRDDKVTMTYPLAANQQFWARTWNGCWSSWYTGESMGLEMDRCYSAARAGSLQSLSAVRPGQTETKSAVLASSRVFAVSGGPHEAACAWGTFALSWLTKTNRHGLDLGFATTHHPSYHPANRHLPHQVPRDVHG